MFSLQRKTKGVKISQFLADFVPQNSGARSDKICKKPYNHKNFALSYKKSTLLVKLLFSERNEIS